MTVFLHLAYFSISLVMPVQAVLNVQDDIFAAAGNLTALNTKTATQWVSDSGIRGTSDILWSCIITLIACIYSAIHLNVPPAHERRWQLIWRKLKWVGMALFAPEVVLYCALFQFWEAYSLKSNLNSIRRAQGSSRGDRAGLRGILSKLSGHAKPRPIPLEAPVTDREPIQVPMVL